MSRDAKTRRSQSKEAGVSPDDLGGLDFEARRAERLKTVAILKTGRTPLHVIEVAKTAAALAEESIEQVKQKYRPPALACKEGCDWCCYLTVGTSVPEVARIVEHLRQTLSPEQMQAARERIASLDEQRRKTRSAGRGVRGLPCALLVDHRCSVYPVRPLTCRGFNSSDARQCELFLNPRNMAVVPMYKPQQRLTTFVLDGMRAGVSECGLKGELLELTAALRIALEVPDAIERWLAGEAVFARARLD